MGEKCAALIRVSGSEAAFAILARVVLFAAFCVVGGRRTRIRREAFGGIFSRFSRRGPKQGLGWERVFFLERGIQPGVLHKARFLFSVSFSLRQPGFL